jgi:hypothetical protein
MDLTATPEGALIFASALGALMLALILWRTAQGARARASEKARAWAEIKRPEWEARAARKAEERASGARTSARIRGALMIAVALVALGATNLSAHGTLDMIARAGLESLDAQIAVIVVFEMFLAILGALSLWHMNHGTGFNKYEAGVWAMASLMGGMSWWGTGSAIFALWPILAAVAWHLVITFGREHKQSALVTWWRMKRGKATSQDSNAVMTERLITRIVNHGYAANEGARALRKIRERAFDRAWADADALGILTPEVRARIQTRIAARYAGARALAPEAVAHMNPWNERASMSARSNARAVRPVSAPPAPALEVSAHVPDDARALTEESAPVSAPPATPSAHSASALIDAVRAHFAGPASALEWSLEYVKTNGDLPTGPDLARAFGLSAANCRKWVTPVRKALA